MFRITKNYVSYQKKLKIRKKFKMAIYLGYFEQKN